MYVKCSNSVSTNLIADTYIERRMGELAKEGFGRTVVVTDDYVLRMVGGEAGNGYLPVYLLLEDLRIAYVGWENVAGEMVTEARRVRPTMQATVTSAELAKAMATLRGLEEEVKETAPLREEEA